MIIQHSLATFHVDSMSKFEEFATHINFMGNLSLAPLNIIMFHSTWGQSLFSVSTTSIRDYRSAAERKTSNSLVDIFEQTYIDRKTHTEVLM